MGGEEEAEEKSVSALFLPDLGLLLPEPSVTVLTGGWTSRELLLLVPCVVLGAFLLGALISILVLLLRVKGKYGACGAPRAAGKARARGAAPQGEGSLGDPSGSSSNSPWTWENLLMGRIFPACPAAVDQ